MDPAQTLSPIREEELHSSQSPATGPSFPIILRLRNIYLSAALLLLNTLAALLIGNLLLAGLFWIRDFTDNKALAAQRNAVSAALASGRFFNPDGSPLDNGKRNEYQSAWIDFNAYGNLEPAYVSDVLDDFYELSNLGMTFQPWVLFSEPPFQGKRVTVEIDPRGFPRRKTVNPEYKQGIPVVQILTLGGSTTFGYNVSDEHTWPTYLSEILNRRAREENLNIQVEVLNYGKGFYHPSQETLLLLDLLKNGYRPSLVLFLDGVNWSGPQDVPQFYEQARRRFQNLQFDDQSARGRTWADTWGTVPMVRLAKSISQGFFGVTQPTVAQRASDEGPSLVPHVVNGFRQNRMVSEAICKSYSIKPLFILQPNAVYNYPIELYRRPLPDEFFSWRSKTQGVYRSLSSDPGLLDLSNLFQTWGTDRKAIIDELHYSPPFNRFLAEQIAAHIHLKALPTHVHPYDETAVTGNPRESDLPVTKR